MTQKWYIAGPWFTPRQDEILQMVKAALDHERSPYYSPKDEALFVEGKTFDAKEVFQSNIDAILNCGVVIVITDGKDIGTIFEAGVAYASNIPILYFWCDHGDSPLNLMLAQSGHTVALGMDQLTRDLAIYRDCDESLPRTDYSGKQE